MKRLFKCWHNIDLDHTNLWITIIIIKYFLWEVAHPLPSSGWLTDWCKQTSLSQCQTDTEADLINHFDHSCSVLNVGPISVKSIFGPQTICVKVLSWVRLYQQIVKSSSDSPVASRALCFLCRSVGLSDLIPLMLLSFHSLQKPKATALDTPLSLEWLVSQPCWQQQTNRTLLSSPQQMDCCQNKETTRAATVTLKLFSKESKHLITPSI